MGVCLRQTSHTWTTNNELKKYKIPRLKPKC